MPALQDLLNYMQSSSPPVPLQPKLGVGGIPIDGDDQYGPEGLTMAEQAQLYNATPDQSAPQESTPPVVAQQALGEVQRLGQNAAIAVPQTLIADPAYMEALPQEAYHAITRGQLGGATLTDEGFQAIKDDKQKFTDEYEHNNPQASFDDLNKAYTAYTNTPQYQKFFDAQPTVHGVAIGDFVRKSASDMAGLPVDQQQPRDTTAQNVIGAMIPNPLAFGSGIMKGAEKIGNAGEKVAADVSKTGRTTADYILTDPLGAANDGEKLAVKVARNADGTIDYVSTPSHGIVTAPPQYQNVSDEEAIANMLGDHPQGTPADVTKVQAVNPSVTAKPYTPGIGVKSLALLADSITQTGLPTGMGPAGAAVNVALAGGLPAAVQGFGTPGVTYIHGDPEPDPLPPAYDPSREVQLPQVAADQPIRTLAAAMQTPQPGQQAQAPLNAPLLSKLDLNPIASAMAAEQQAPPSGNINNPPIAGAQQPIPTVNIPKPLGQSQGWTPGEIGGLATVGVALASLAVPAVRRLIKAAPTADVAIGPEVSMNEAAQQARTARGLADDTLGGSGPISNAGRYIDQAAGPATNIEQLGRDLGGQQGADKLVGITQGYFTQDAKQQAATNFRNEGQLPSGGTMPVAPQAIADMAKTLSPQDYDLWAKSIWYENALNTRYNELTSAVDKHAALSVSAASDPQDIIDAAQRVSDIQSDSVMWKAYNSVSSPEMEQLVAAREANPALSQLTQAFDDNNKYLLDQERKQGVISAAQYRDRMAMKNYTQLGENLGQGGPKIDSGVERSAIVDPAEVAATPPGVQPAGMYNRSRDPISAMMAQGTQRVEALQDNIGKRVFNRAVATMDTGPQSELYVWGHTTPSAEALRNGGIVTTYVRGQPYYTQYARRAVADAINLEGLGLNGLMSAQNNMRKLFQMFTTGGISAPLTAAKSLLYDIPTMTATAREGMITSPLSLLIHAGAHKIAPGNQALQRVAHFLSAADGGLSMYAQAVGATLPMSIGHSIAKSSMEGIISAIARNEPWTKLVPGMQNNLSRLADVMHWAIDNSTIEMLHSSNALPTHGGLRELTNVKNNYQAIADHYFQGGRDVNGVGKVATAAFNGWKALVNAAHTAPAITAAINTRALREMQLGRRLTNAEAMTVGGKAATAMGNYQLPASGIIRKEGQSTRGNLLGAGVKFATTGTQYLNVGIQTLRSVTKALVGEGAYQGARTAVGIAGIVGLHNKSAQIFTDGDPAATDWYYNKLSTVDRLGTVLIPTPQTVMYGRPKFDPTNPTAGFYKLSLAPEIKFFTSPVMMAMDELGLTNKPKNSAPVNVGQQLLTAAQQGTGVEVPQAVQLIGALGGRDLSLQNAAEGRGMISAPPEPKFQGAAQPSFFHEVVGNVLRATLGSTAQRLNQMFDEGINAHERGFDAEETAKKIGIGQAQMLERSVPDAPGLWKGVEKFSTSTPEAEVVRDNQDALKLINNQIQLDVGKRSYVYTGSPTMMNDPRMITLAEIGGTLGKAFLKVPQNQYEQAQATLSNLRNNKMSYSADQIYDGTYQKAIDAQIRVVQATEAAMSHGIDQANGAIAKIPAVSNTLKQAGYGTNIKGIAEALANNLTYRKQM